MFVLQNSLGLYLQVMSVRKTDFSFTHDVNEALSFLSQTEAEGKSRKLRRFKTKVIQIDKISL